MPTRAIVAALFSLLLGCSDSDIDHSVLIEIPASVASTPAGTLRVALYRYDPFLMDAAATQVDLAVIAFSHRVGEPTFVRARLVDAGGW